MLEHFHTDDRIESSPVRFVVEGIDGHEAEAGTSAKSRAAVVDLQVVELGPHRLAGPRVTRLEQREKRPVATAVIKNPTPGECPRELKPRFEPAAMTPRNQPILAEDLFARVVAVAQRRVGFTSLIEY